MLKNFTVMDVIRSRSDSVATVEDGAIRFNNPTAKELDYAPYVQLLINAKESQFAICACKETDRSSVAFSKPKGEQRYKIKISAPAASSMIYKMMGWDKEKNMSVPGVYLADENAILYDCNAAYEEVKRTWGGNRYKKKAQEETAEEIEEALENE